MNIPGFHTYSNLLLSRNLFLIYATRNSDKQAVLIKLLDLKNADDEDILQFKNDFNHCKSQNSQFVAQAISIEESNDYLYQVHQDIYGKTLNEVLSSRSFSVEETLLIALNIVECLKSVHDNELIHNNVCSHSILLEPNSLQTKLWDLRFATDKNQAGSIASDLNTDIDLAYISPEKTGRNSQLVDLRSDLYSLGVTLYYLTTQRLPFQSTKPQELIHWQLVRMPIQPRAINVSVPKVLSDIIVKLMAKHASQRYQSINGLMRDLEHCQQTLADHDIPDFKLGQYDFSSQFHIPDKIYGRDEEIKKLKLALKKCQTGQAQFVTIAGVEGTGKSALAREITNHLDYDCPLLRGKYEQLKNTLPLLAFSQALDDLSTFILSQPPEQLDIIRTNILTQLGDNICVLTQFAPKLHFLCDKNVQVSELGPAENRNRFIATIKTFFATVATKESPLVLVLDNLQWADPASIELLKNLISIDNPSYLLVIVCYRNNRINDNPPISELINSASAIGHYTAITLNNLTKSDLRALVSNTLQMSYSAIEPVAEHIYALTKGNAFFTQQYFQSLYNDNFLIADLDESKWQWDKLELDLSRAKCSPTELITRKLKQLPKITVELLNLASLLGSEFKRQELSLITDKDLQEINSLLSKASNLGLIIKSDTIYNFSHDRIQECISALISKKKSTEQHLQIARKLTQHLESTRRDNRIFEICQHFNANIEALSSAEKKYIMQLNLNAARKAIVNTAYTVALHHTTVSFSLLDDKQWSSDQPFAFQLTLEHARSLYLNAQYSPAKLTIELALKQSLDFEQRVIIYAIRKDILISEGHDFTSAVDAGLEILKSIDINFSKNDSTAQTSIKNGIDEIESYLKGKNTRELIDLPDMTDKSKRLLMHLLIDLWEAAYYAGNETLMQQTNITMVITSFNYGNTSESAFGYVLYGMSLSIQEKYNQAYEFGNLALKLNEKVKDKIMLPKVVNLFCNYINFYNKPFSNCSELYEKSAATGRQNGDHLFGLWAAIFVVWTKLLCNDELTSTLDRAAELTTFIDQTRDTKMIYTFRMLKITCLQLRGENLANYGFSEKQLAEYLKYWKDTNFIPGITWHAIVRGQYLFFSGKYKKCYELLTKKGLAVSLGIVMFPLTQLYIYRALSAARLINNSNIDNASSYLPQLEKDIKQLEIWACHCPENFAAQLTLVEAEYARYNQKQFKAAKLYDRATKLSGQYSPIYIQALCNQFTAEFWLESGFYKFHYLYITTAISYYDAWGATKLTDQLHKSLNTENEQNKKITSNKQAHKNITDLSKTNTLKSVGKSNAASIVKLTKSISREIDQNRLLDTTIKIILESADAIKGALILNESNQLIVSTVATLTNKLTISKLQLPLNKFNDIPQEIVQLVARTHEDVITINALKEDAFRSTHYIRSHSAKSIFCTPVLHNANLVAVLYLENNIYANVFTQEKIETIKIILAQLAVSLENAQLYKTLESEIEKQQQTEQQLRASDYRMRQSQFYANIGTWDWDIDTNELYWSETISPMLGYPVGSLEVSFENFINAVHIDDREKVNEAIQACFDGADYHIEHRVAWPDGSIHWMSETGDVIRDQNNRPTRMLGITQDITERIKNREEHSRLENQLRQSQKMQAIGQLTGGIAHDFNNILASIIGFTQLSLKMSEQHNDDKLNRYLNQAIDSARRASELVNQMMAFSRRTKAEIQSLSISPVITETLKILRPTFPSTIELHVNEQHSVPDIMSNSVQLGQIIMNICINARDAMMGHGNIEISVNHRNKHRGTCSSCHEIISGNFVELSIADNGGGIHSDITHSIFDPFFSTKHVGKGTGMGLSIVHGIVHEQHGHITVESKEGVGTNILVYLPVSVKQPSNQTTTMVTNVNTHPNHLTSKKHIIIVDDEPAVAELIGEIMATNNYDITIETDSKDAWNRLQDNLDNYDLLITDQTMPKLTGVELSQKVLSLNPQFPIILCTGYSADIDDSRAEKIGIARLLKKPFDYELLCQTALELLTPEMELNKKSLYK